MRTLLRILLYVVFWACPVALFWAANRSPGSLVPDLVLGAVLILGGLKFRGTWFLPWFFPFVYGFVIGQVYPEIFSTLSVVLGLVAVLYAYPPKWFNKLLSLFGKGSDVMGSATFWGIKEAKKLGRVQPVGQVMAESYGLPLGRLSAPGFDPRFRYTGHVLTVAPTGSGKGRGAVIPTLLEYPGSAFVVDIKGENFEVTSKYRSSMFSAEEDHRVVRVDPFGVCGPGGDSFDVLGWLKSNPEEWVSDSAYIAEALVVGNEGDHWDESAKTLLQALCLFVVSHESERSLISGEGFRLQDNTISEVRRLVTLETEDFTEVLTVMKDSINTLVSRAGSSLLSTPEKELGSILSTARRHTAFLDEPRIAKALSSSTFQADALKRESMTIYLVIPPDRISMYGRFIRLLATVSVSGLTRTKGKPLFNVLFLFDEFAQLGRMSLIENAISLIRGYGGMFWIFIQDLSQLKAVYPKWQTFLANSAKQFFGTADLDTAKYISETLGKSTVGYSTASESNSQGGSSESTSSHLVARELMSPDEIMSMNRSKAVVLIQNERPWLVDRLDYLRDKEFEGLFEENPYHAKV